LDDTFSNNSVINSASNQKNRASFMYTDRKLVIVDTVSNKILFNGVISLKGSILSMTWKQDSLYFSPENKTLLEFKTS